MEPVENSVSETSDNQSRYFEPQNLYSKMEDRYNLLQVSDIKALSVIKSVNLDYNKIELSFPIIKILLVDDQMFNLVILEEILEDIDDQHIIIE